MPSEDVLALTSNSFDARWNTAGPVGTPIFVTFSLGDNKASYDPNVRPGYSAWTEQHKRGKGCSGGLLSAGYHDHAIVRQSWNEGASMQITVSEFGNEGKTIVLVGYLDTTGAQEVALPLAKAAESRCDIVVDLSGVEFITSMGIRQLVLAARSARKIVLLNPNPLVTKILHLAELQDQLPIVRSEDEAKIALASATRRDGRRDLR